jgi:hypothetical protein
MSYQSELANKNYQENVVIKMMGEYFAFHQPDSGLTIKRPYLGVVASCVLNPTQVDIRKPSTTIASYSFKIIDRNWCVSNLVQGTGAQLNGQQVEIFIGRVGVSMPFSDYKALPKTRIKKQDYVDNAYTIASSEETDRIDRPIYQINDNLLNDILESTTVLRARDSIEDFPSSGYVKINEEIIKYEGIDLDNNDLTGCTRGEFGTQVSEHSADDEIFYLEPIQGNPLDVLLMILTSGSGTGDYDLLESGCAIDPSLIDVAGIEALRDELFSDHEFYFYFFNISSALKDIENRILTPLRLRLVTNENAKISVRQMDKIAITDPLEITDDSIRGAPKWSVDDNKIINSIVVEWDMDSGTGKYRQKTESVDEDSEASYGLKSPLKLQFSDVRASLNGQEIVDDFIRMIFNRMAQPSPEISLNTHIDKSEMNVLDRLVLSTGYLPSFDGGLNFSSEVEIISRAINHNTGDVQFKLAFTSGSMSRFCYISPTDLAQEDSSGVLIRVPAGRGDMYRVGWKMRLYDNATRDYVPGEPVNTIQSITDDEIVFEQGFQATIVPGQHRIKFADYDEVVEDQKRFCFISAEGGTFADGKRTYVITL